MTRATALRVLTPLIPSPFGRGETMPDHRSPSPHGRGRPAGSAGGVKGSSVIIAHGTAEGSGGVVVSTPARMNVYGTGSTYCFGRNSPASVRTKLAVVPLTPATNPLMPLARSR